MIDMLVWVAIAACVTVIYLCREVRKNTPAKERVYIERTESGRYIIRNMNDVEMARRGTNMHVATHFVTAADAVRSARRGGA